MIKPYSKLVRDYIPEIIESDGNVCVTEILSDDHYLQMLDTKLTEELSEYQENKSLEKLADLLEVMRAVVRARGSLCPSVDIFLFYGWTAAPCLSC